MRYSLNPVQPDNSVIMTSTSDDGQQEYGRLLGKYDETSRSITVTHFEVQDNYKGRNIELNTYAALPTLALRQLHYTPSVLLGDEIPQDLKKKIEDLMKKAKFMH